MHPVLLTLLVLIVIGSVLYCYLITLRKTDYSIDVKSTKGFMDKLNIVLCDFAVLSAFSHIDSVCLGKGVDKLDPEEQSLIVMKKNIYFVYSQYILSQSSCYLNNYTILKLFDEKFFLLKIQQTYWILKAL